MADNGHRSFGEVFQDAVGHIQEIVRAEIRLAKVEVRDEVGKTKQAAIMFGGGAVMGLFAGALLMAAAVCALAIVIPWWAASLVMAVLCGILAGSMVMAGRMRMKAIHSPEKTMGTVAEDLQWARNQTH